MCIETGKIYSHIKEAATELNMANQAGISLCLQDSHRVAYGYHWCKINDDNISYLLNQQNRFEYLVECYSYNTDKCILVCFEDMTIYKNQEEFTPLPKYHIEKFKNILEIMNRLFLIIENTYLLEITVALHSDMH
jgi:hypothetical protein